MNTDPHQAEPTSKPSFVPLHRLATTIRSKNAKPYRLTFDVIFTDADYYRYVTDTCALLPQNVARLYGVSEDAVTSYHEFEAGLAVKITLRRTPAQGALGEPDMYGAQQHTPLMTVPIPWDGSLPLPPPTEGL